MSNAEKVLATMRQAGKPLKNGEIEQLSGLSKTDVEKAMKQLKDSELVISPKRCYWEPKQ
jgi:predicted transcriptional regulator